MRCHLTRKTCSIIEIRKGRARSTLHSLEDLGWKWKSQSASFFLMAFPYSICICIGLLHIFVMTVLQLPRALKKRHIDFSLFLFYMHVICNREKCDEDGPRRRRYSQWKEYFQQNTAVYCKFPFSLLPELLSWLQWSFSSSASRARRRASLQDRASTTGAQQSAKLKFDLLFFFLHTRRNLSMCHHLFFFFSYILFSSYI